MAKLLKRRPGKKKLYFGLDPDTIDSDPIKVKSEWILKATHIKTKKSLNAHIKRGNFGETQKISGNLYRIEFGHRAICVFNNMTANDRRVTTGKTEILTRHQYKDLKSGKPMREEEPTLRGEPVSKKTSMKSYSKEDFFAVPKYSKSNAKELATERVDNEVRDGSVSWSDLPVDEKEYQESYEARVAVYYRELRDKIILIVKDKPSAEVLKEAEDLPIGLMDLVDSKMTQNQAEYFLTRMVQFSRAQKVHMDNPAIRYAIEQVIREEIRIEHYRDLQDLQGDEIDVTVQNALDKAITRHQKLMPKEFMIKTGKGENDDDPPHSNENDLPVDESPMRDN